MYMQGITDQTRIFLYAFGFGFVLGIVYDVFRVIRLAISVKKRFIYVQDILYAVVCSLLTFLFILIVNKGQIMGYILFGEFLGWLIYYFSLGVVTVKLSNKTIKVVRALMAAFIGAVKRPVLYVSRKIKGVFIKFGEKTHNKSKKILNKSKFCLKIRLNMLYNLKNSMSLARVGEGKRKNGRFKNEKA